jgi:alkylhydroperoxidase family enzyme
MTWIKTVPPTPDNAPLLEALGQQAALYPPEYDAVQREACRVPDIVQHDSIVLAHSLIPPALAHAFATFGVLLDPILPLSRRQHEMIATTVSALNRCVY